MIVELYTIRYDLDEISDEDLADLYQTVQTEIELTEMPRVDDYQLNYGTKWISMYRIALERHKEWVSHCKDVLDKVSAAITVRTATKELIAFDTTVS